MEEISTPIDRGWAWVVLIACFFESILLFGVLKSFGLFFVEFLQAFNTTSSTISWVLSVQTITFSVIALFVLNIGPIYFNNRTFVMFGGCMASTAYMVTAFAPTVEILFLSNGVIFGFSMAFVHGPALVMLGRYFNKRRGLANSIANSGSSIGGLVFPPMIRYTLDEFGLRGSLIIISGLLLNIIVFGMLLRPLELSNTDIVEVNIKEISNATKEDKLNGGLLSDITEKSQYSSSNDEINSRNISKGDLAPENKSETTNYISSGKSDRKLSKHLSYELLTTETDFRQRTFSTNSRITGRTNYVPKPFTTALNSLSKSSLALGGDMLGSLGNIRFDKTKFEKPETEANRQVTCLSLISKIIDYRLFRNKLYMILVLSGLFGMFGSAMLITYIPPHAKDLKIEKNQIALLISIISGLDIVGRFITGIIADREFVKRHNLICIAFMTTGIACHLTPLFTEFWSLAIFAAIYGCFGGVYFSLFPVVIVDFAGLDKLASGLAILMVVHGTCISVTVPVIGAIRDSTGSYLGSLHMIGTCLIVAALILLLEPIARKWQCRSSTSQVIGDNI